MQLSKAPEPELGRDLYWVALSAVSEITAALSSPPSRHFVLFLALDARNVPDDDILSVARALLPMGLGYVVAWGPDCERVHDLFDRAEIERELVKDSGSVVMTTWHDNEPLEEALWFAVVNTVPAPPYDEDCTSVIAVSVSNQDWNDLIQAYLSNTTELKRAVGL